MHLNVETIGSRRIITLWGETLEAGNTHEFKRDITPLLEASGHVIVDLSRVGFIDSSGCGALLHCLRRLQTNGGTLAVCGLNRHLWGLFKAIQMDRKIPLYPSRGQALAEAAAVPEKQQSDG
jgi:anti-sigma B factor antagonist